MLKQVLPFFLLPVIISCNTGSAPATQQTTDATVTKVQWQPPAAGATVTEYKERVTDDNLNEKYFRVTVIATESSKEGTYRLKLEYGFNINETEVHLPEWNKGVTLKPLLKKGDGNYHCLLGFDTGDGQFRELYTINAEGGDIRLKQPKGYFKSQL
jgi:hypothetical protein